ncbi:MAG: cell division protein SepF [Candidatus Thorarchaeota archaeon]
MKVRLFKRKTEDERSREIQTPPMSPHATLGVFSPALELPQSDPVRETRRLAELDQIFIRSKSLQSLEDVPFVVNEIRNGNIVLLDITQLNNGQEQSYLELKRIIERIRGETREYDADIALVNEKCLIVTPSFVRF